MNILIIGATSAIAEAFARIYAQQSATFLLLARDEGKLETLAADLSARGAVAVNIQRFDAADMPKHANAIKQAQATLQTIDIVLIAHGTLSDQKACEKDVNLMLHEMIVNGLAVLSLLTLLAPVFEAQGKGTMAAISSVAGDRGRASNYVYGTAKAMVSVFMEGLRNRLAGRGVQVLTIKPGFVDTPMTKQFTKGMLWASPEKVARDIWNAIEKKKDVLYTPWFWWVIMMIIIHMPRFAFKRLKL